jgi:hypothetical protein
VRASRAGTVGAIYILSLYSGAMLAVVRQRLKWVRMYAETHDAGLTCLRCGVSRPTLRLWASRYCAIGDEGLLSRGRRLHRSPKLKVSVAVRELILACRCDRNLSARQIQNELRLDHRIELSVTTIEHDHLS